jgi:putative DNA primase/helicase
MAKLSPAEWRRAIPTELKALKRWVGRVAKAPLHPVREVGAKSGQPATWGTFDEAAEFYERYADAPDRGAGFEFAAEDGLVGVDFDLALDPDGNLYPWAAALLQPFEDLGGAYIEVSPSGRGLHLITRAQLPRNPNQIDFGGVREGKRASHVEVYREKRYFTITGDVWRGNHAIGDCQSLVQGLLDTTGLTARMAAREQAPPAPEAALEPHREAEIRSALGSLDPDIDYPDWLSVGMALQAGLGRDGFHLWDDWSSLGRKYEGSDNLLGHWRSFTPGKGIGLGTLFHMAQARGWVRPSVSAVDEFAPYSGIRHPTVKGTPRAAGVPTDLHQAMLKFLDETFEYAGRRTLRYWRGAYYRWTGTHWKQMEASRDSEIEIEARVSAWIVLNGDTPKPAVLTGIIRLLRSEVFLEKDFEDGAWLGAGPPPDSLTDTIPLQNGLFHWRTRTLRSHTPDFFNLNVRAFAWDPSATAPLWERTLAEWFGNDFESAQALREMVAYVVSGRTDHERAFYLYGPPRSGKSTTADVLTALIGEDHTAELSFKQLGERFGLDDLPGKRLVLFRDARQGLFEDRAAATETILKITGRDRISIDRKNRDKWTGIVQAVMVILSNVMARFQDVSGTIATRLIVIKFTKSFLGAEDPSRKKRVLEELPGIFNWALDGLARLQERGHLMQPASALEEQAALERGASPLIAFADEMLTFGEAASISEEALYGHYRQWAVGNGHRPMNKSTLVNGLCAYAAGHQHPIERTRPGGRTAERPRMLRGVGIRPDRAE